MIWKKRLDKQLKASVEKLLKRSVEKEELDALMIRYQQFAGNKLHKTRQLFSELINNI